MKDQQTPLAERKVVRRGLLSGLAALCAGAMFKLNGASKAEATNGDAVLVGGLHAGINPTSFKYENAAAGPALFGIGAGAGDQTVFGTYDGVQGVAMVNQGYAAGIRGQNRSLTQICAAVVGDTVSANGVGVVGRAGPIPQPEVMTRGGIGVDGQAASGTAIGTRGINAQNGTGVYGVSNATSYTADGDGSGAGVSGKSGSGPGVRGESTTGAGVFGKSGTQPGIDGVSTNSLGIRGTSTNFVGIVGISTNSHGLYGSTNRGAGAFGIVAENNGANGPGLLVTGTQPSQIFGGLQVFGPKNAVLKMQDDTFASVYCQESPEPYFEDFGRTRLVSGVANVQLEREFAQLVAGGEYSVFLTPEGASSHLFVSRLSATSFEVREGNNGMSNIPFSYRIVTKRKDIDGKRFARVSVEAAKSVASVRAALASSAPVNGPQGRLTPPPVLPSVQPSPLVYPPTNLPAVNPPSSPPATTPPVQPNPPAGNGRGG